jgi:predicted phosphodiesterase
MRIALVTDIHEDIISLENAFRIIEKSKVDEIICLGDISGFSVPSYSYQRERNAHKCLKLLKDNCKTIILGNHDIHAGKIIPKRCSFFDYPEDWYKLGYFKRKELAKGILWLHEECDLDPLYFEEDIEYLNSLPEIDTFDIPEHKILLSHYIYPNISGLKREFYTYQDEFRQHFEYMRQSNCAISFTGHAHTKGVFIVDERKYRQIKKGKFILDKLPVCIGIPPITRGRKTSGFCIFDSDEMSVQSVKY